MLRMTLSRVALTILFLLFCFLFLLNKTPHSLYEIHSDTIGYERLSLDPWDGFRPPGYTALVNLFLLGTKDSSEIYQKYPGEELLKNDRALLNEKYNELGLGRRLKLLAFFQVVVFSCSLAALLYALSCQASLAPPIWFMILLGGFLSVDIVNPGFILSESLAFPLIAATLASLLLFEYRRKIFFLYLGCFLSSWTFLTRASCLFLLILSSIYLIMKIIQKLVNQKQCILSIICLFIGYGYIVLISITGAGVFVGTMAADTNNMISCFLMDKKDIENMPTERAKKFADEFLSNKKAFEENFMIPHHEKYFKHPERYSRVSRFNKLAWNYAYQGTMEVYKNLFHVPTRDDISLKVRAQLSAEVRRGVMKRHFWEWVELVYKNLWAGLGFDSTYAVSKIAKILGANFMLFGFMLTIAACILCPPLRTCILLLFFTHILQVIACAFGASINSRYIRLTEIFLLLSYFTSFWGLCFLHYKKGAS